MSMNFDDFLKYSEYCREKVSAVLKTLPVEIFTKNFLGMGEYNSIQILLAHIIAVEDSWIQEDIYGREWKDFNPEDYPTPQSVSEKWEEVRLRTKTYIASLTPKEMNRTITVNWGKTRTFTVEKILVQIFTHEIHHLGQVNTLLRMNDIDPPKLDYIRM